DRRRGQVEGDGDREDAGPSDARRVYFAANGVHIVGTTVMATPYTTRTIPIPNSRSCVFRFQSIRRMVRARKCEKNASAPPSRRSTSARKSNAFPAASADPIGTKTDAVHFAV